MSKLLSTAMRFAYLRHCKADRWTLQLFVSLATGVVASTFLLSVIGRGRRCLRSLGRRLTIVQAFQVVRFDADMQTSELMIFV